MNERDFSVISPSAKMILLMRGYTEIPFARKAAEIISSPEKFETDYENNDFSFWARVLHFETRYFSINQLLEDIEIKNILELSSGFTFRSLDKTENKNCFYIDTDLPEIICSKKQIAEDLIELDKRDNLKFLPLNVLDENEFKKVISNFPEGPIVIVNEGLLMYLDNPEKEKLCNIIYNVLKKRGGYWITSDIYLKNKIQELDIKTSEELKKFKEQNPTIEDNKFESFTEAEEFFNKNGFTIDREVDIDYSKISSMKYFLKSLESYGSFEKKENKMQTTWRLKIK